MGCRCYERLQPNNKEFTRLAYTELVLELEHLKIETMFVCVCVCVGGGGKMCRGVNRKKMNT
jgi:hypothetical protein